MDRSSPKACASNSTLEANAVRSATLAHTHTDARNATLSTHCTRAAPTTSVDMKPRNLATHLQHTSEINPRPLKRTADNNSLADKYSVIQPLPTPVNVNALREYLHGYDPDARKFLLNGFSHGFDLGDNAEIISSSPDNSPSINFSTEQAHAKIIKEVEAGRMAGPFTEPPFDPFHISPIGLRPKKLPGQFRLIRT